jgi:hypothetical protein
VAPIQKLALGEVLLGLVDMVEDMEFPLLGVPNNIFAASKAVIEED